MEATSVGIPAQSLRTIGPLGLGYRVEGSLAVSQGQRLNFLITCNPTAPQIHVPRVFGVPMVLDMGGLEEQVPFLR